MSHLFSQIPYVVLDKAGCGRGVDDDKPGPKSKKKRKYSEEFYEEDEVRPKEITTILEEGDSNKEINIFSSPPLPPPPDEATLDESLNDQITSSLQDPPKQPVQTHDAIIQTSPKKMVSRAVQTDESMITRPLSSTDNDIHRMNMQTYAPITPIPKCTNGSNPPLRIGLTLRGKKRRVYYPDLEDLENHDA